MTKKQQQQKKWYWLKYEKPFDSLFSLKTIQYDCTYLI